MKRVELVLYIIVAALAFSQAIIPYFASKIGAEKARKELKDDMTEVFGTLNEEQRKKFLENLSLNRDEIVLQVNKQTKDSKKEIVSLVMPEFRNIKSTIESNSTRLEDKMNDILNIIGNNPQSKVNSKLLELVGANFKEVMKEAKRIQKESESNYLKGIASQIIGEDNKAISFYVKALGNEIDANLRMNILRRLGDIYRINYKYNESFDYYDNGIKVFSEIEYRTLYTIRVYRDILNNFSILLMDRGYKDDIVKSKELLEKALTIDRELLSHNIYEHNLSKSLQNLGISYKKLGEYSNAKVVLEEAFLLEEKFLDNNRSAENLKSISLTYGNYALILRDEKADVNVTYGFFRKACDLSKEALDIAQKEMLVDVDSYKVNASSLGMNFAKFLMNEYRSDVNKLNQAETLLKSRQAILYGLWKDNEVKFGLELANTAVAQSALCIHRIYVSQNTKVTNEQKKYGLDYCRQAKNYLKIYPSDNPKAKNVLKRINYNENILLEL